MTRRPTHLINEPGRFYQPHPKPIWDKIEEGVIIVLAASLTLSLWCMTKVMSAIFDKPSQ